MEERKKIILVDDDITNLTVGKNALSDAYDTYTVPSGEKLMQLLNTVHPDMILLDINMPGMNGYDIIANLKRKQETVDIPVVFLTSKSDMDSELQGLTLGAIDYINKPFSAPLLRKRIETHLLVIEQQRELRHYNRNLKALVSEKARTVFELQNAVLNTVAELVECRDDVTGGHISRTQEYLQLLLEEMFRGGVYEEETSTWDLEFLIPSAQLHDVGKIMVPDYILKKPGRLTSEEFEQMKQHTTQGAKIIETIERSTTENTFLKHAKIFALYHHEKWDGSGYPLGLCGEEIPLQGRMMAIVDVYDALVSERPYKRAFSHEEAVDIITEQSGKQFDPVLVEVFRAVADQIFAVAKDKQGEKKAIAQTKSIPQQAMAAAAR